MTDQLFLGLSPKSDAGKEYFFFCMDDWLEIHKFIWTVFSDEFPPHPHLDSETAELLAELLQKYLDFGIAHAYFLFVLRHRYFAEVEGNTGNNFGSQLWLSEDGEEVKQMIDLLKGFILFLRECGGCRVDS